MWRINRQTWFKYSQYTEIITFLNMSITSSQKASQKLKYKLQDLENDLKKGAADLLRTKLPDFGVSVRSYDRHKRILATSDQSISQRALDTYARLFGVEISELYTEKPKAQSIEEMYEAEVAGEPEVNEVADKFNLS